MIYSILWAIAVLMGYDMANTALKTALGDSFAGRDMLLTCALVGAGCVLVYFVLTRYASTFIYVAGDDGVSIIRKTGHREKRFDIAFKDIRCISRSVPGMKIAAVCKMKKTVFSRKNTYCLVYQSGGKLNMIEFEPSAALAEKIKEGIK